MPAVATYTRARYQLRQQRSPTLIVQPDQIVLQARTDPGKFGEYVCGKVPADIHRSWFPILVPGASNDMLNLTAGDSTSLLSFRGSAKNGELVPDLMFEVRSNQRKNRSTPAIF